MKFILPNRTIAVLLSFVVLFNISCNKDSDLLIDYVVEYPKSILLDDIVIFTLANQAILIEPIDQKTYKEPEKVIITDITAPTMGSAEIRNNNAIIYTPKADKNGIDVFNYTTSITNMDKTISSQTGKVSVTVEPRDTVPLSGKNIFYVTTTGKSTHSGDTENTAWDIKHAFEVAKAGDIVYIKAGNYGDLNLKVMGYGTASEPIKFIGYTNTPGDLTSNNGSTFKHGDQLDPNKMPMLKGSSTTKGTALDLYRRPYIQIINMQIRDYMTGVMSTGTNALFKNVIVAYNGEQKHNNEQGGRGFQIYGDYTVLEDCYSLDSNGEGINIKGANKCRISYTSVYSLNKINPGGYYIAITNGGSGNIIENCVVYRDKDADAHQGHGYVLKDMATNNIIRNSVAYNTGIEVNFSGVYSNLFEGIKIYGSFSSNKEQFTSCIRIANGTHDNTFKDIQILDSRYAINFVDYVDGYIGPGGNRDEQAGGHNNKFINISVDKAQNIIGATSSSIGSKAFSNNNSFSNCTFKNITGTPIFSYQTMRNTSFMNCNFQNIPNHELIVNYNGGSFSSSFNSPILQNVQFSNPVK